MQALKKRKTKHRMIAFLLALLMAIPMWSLPVSAEPDAGTATPTPTQTEQPEVTPTQTPQATEDGESPTSDPTQTPEDQTEPTQTPQEAEQTPQGPVAAPQNGMTVEQILALIEQLPTAEDINCANFTGDKDAVYMQLMTVSDAVDALTDEQKAQLGTEALEKVDALLAYFANLVEPHQTIGTPNGAAYVSNTMNDFTMVGPYQFNMAGNTVTRGKYDINSQYAISLHSDTAAEKQCGTLPANVGGKLTTNTNTNSSTSVLKNNGGRIAKAYLVVTATQAITHVNANTAPMAAYGMYLKGPKGQINHYYPSTLYVDTDKCRTSMYVDVTDFVKSQGYGAYTGINIPYENMTANTWGVGTDLFGAWKLIVIEENTDLPLRMVRLKLGGTSIRNTGPTSVTIQGDGLVVAGNGTTKRPTGEFLFSADGTDMQASQQSMQYKSNVNASFTSISNNMHAANRFFTFQISNKGQRLQNTPGAVAAYQANSTNKLTVPGVNNGANFTQYDTDFVSMTINDPNNAKSMQLSGGETSVTLRASSNNEPAMLSALGLAVDIVVPEFEADMTVTNLTQHYSTKDAGYDLKTNYAVAGDRLRVEATSQNTSTSSQNIGLKDGVFVVEAPALMDVDQATISGKYYPPGGAAAIDLTPQVSGTTIRFVAPADQAITSGGKFEVSFEGNAKTGGVYETYTNKASMSGTFVDDEGNHYSTFTLENLGIAYADTSSDVLHNQVNVIVKGNGQTTGEGSYPFDGTATVTWTPDADNFTQLVIVDGVVRDDIVEDGQVEIPINNKDHDVYVIFAQGERPVKSDYLIATFGDDHVAQLTPSETITAGQDHVVAWVAEEGYTVSQIIIDGIGYHPLSDQGSFTFKGVSADHMVSIHTVKEFAYVDTIVHGPGQITQSSSVQKGSDYNVEWSPIGNAVLSSVKINGQVVYDELQGIGTPDITNHLFSNIQEDQKVEVVYRNADGSQTGDSLFIRTELLNGTGTISPSLEVSKGDNYTVTWAPDSGYIVEKIVYYRGSERVEIPAADKNSLDLNNITEDYIVQVYLRHESEPGSDDLFNIVSIISGGHGTITPGQLNVPRGENRTIEWQPAEGYYVKSVVVDGQVRDDLLKATSYEFANIQADHSITVYLGDEKTDPPTEPSDFYRVDTELVGNGTITDSTVLKAGEDHTVTWSPAEDENVISVTVDGVLRQDLIAAGRVDFVDIASNHTVKVVFTQNGLNPPDGQPQIITRLEGGPGTITPSATVEKGSDYSITWKPAEGYYVKSVVVDGQIRDDLINAEIFDFTGITTDHTVTVYLADEKTDPPVEPSDLYRVDTKVIGNGTISDSVLVKPGEDHTVTWSAASGESVISVKVDGIERPDLIGAGQVEFIDIAANHTVEVTFTQDQQPPVVDDMWTINTRLEGGKGTISASATVKTGENYQVNWQANTGYWVKSIVVDGQVRDDLLKLNSFDFTNITANHTITVYLADETVEPPVGPSDLYQVDTKVIGNGTISDSVVVKAGEDHTVTWSAAQGENVVSVKVDGIERPDLIGAGQVEFIDIAANHTVEVTFTQDTQQPDEDELLTITTDLQGGVGTITASATVKPGESYQVNWQPAQGYWVKSVVVDGQSRDDLLKANSYTFENIDTDHTITVYLADEAVEPPPTEESDLYRVDTKAVGNGTISDSVVVKPGEDHTVTWSAAAGEDVISVKVDGFERPDLIGAGQVSFADIAANHTVEVTFTQDTQPPVVDDMWTITTRLEGGKGTISASVTVEPGESYQVNWQPAEGYWVKSVVVDGQTRDDLLKLNSLDFTNITANHTITVYLADETIEPPPTEESDLYHVDTKAVGNGTISDSVIVKPGEDHTVTWQAEPGESVLSVKVDGFERPDLIGAGQVSFADIAANHTVEVTFTQNQNPPVVENMWTITTGLEGGKGTISASVTVEPGESYQVNWQPAEGYWVKSVVVDGQTRDDLLKLNSLDFTNITANHTITVYLADEAVEPPPTEESDLYHVDTKAIGNGTISDSVVVKPGEDHTVTWQAEPGESVLSVKVDGFERPDLIGAGQVSFADIAANHTVEVTFTQNQQPPVVEDMWTITTGLEGGKGTISASVTVEPGESYQVNWQPAEGYWVKSVVVDGQTRDDLLKLNSFDFTNITANHTITVYLADEAVEPPPTEESDLYRVDTKMEGNGTISDSAVVEPGNDHTVYWEAGKNETVLSVKVDGVERPDLIAAGQVSFIDIAANHTVEVVFSENGVEPGKDLPTVTTRVEGGPGTITASATVNPGDNYPVEWKPAEGYRVEAVIVNGQMQDSLVNAGSYLFENITDDQTITVILGVGEAETKDKVTVSTEIKGQGTVTDTTILNRGDDHTVTWTPEAGWEIDSVYVDGVKLPDDMAQAGSLQFNDLAKDHHVEVIFKQEGAPGPNPDDEKYVVETVISGGLGTITPTTHYPEGADASVSWTVDETNDIAHIYVDGQLRDDLISQGKIDFADLEGNHKVEVVLMPKRPTDMDMEKTAENVTHPDGPNTVGDTIRYTLKATNNSPNSQWDNVVIGDPLPASLTLIRDSIVLIGPDGKQRPVDDSNVIFDEKTNTLAVNVGTLMAGETFTVTFDAKINEKAVGADGGISIKNAALARGTDAAGNKLPDVWSDWVVPGSVTGDGDEGILPLDPDPYIEKKATRIGGQGDLRVGDRILYSIEVGNRLAGSMWADVLVQDPLPAGLTPDLNTLRVVLPSGQRIVPENYAYNESTHQLTVYVGDIYGTDVYHVEFEAVINAEAVKTGIGNMAGAVGFDPEHKPDTPPDAKDPLPDGDGVIKAEIPEKVYPDGFDANSPIVGGPKTSDEFNAWPFVMTCLLAAMAVCLLFLAKKRRKEQAE